MSVEIQMHGSVLADAIKRVAPATGVDPKYPIFGGIQIQVSEPDSKGKRQVTFLATDRYVMARMVVETWDDDRGFDPVPAEIVVAAKLLPKIDPRGLYVLTFGPTHALSIADANGATSVVRELDGEYPKLGNLFVPALEGVISAPALFSIGDKQLGQFVKMAAGLKGNGINFAFTAEGANTKAMVVTFTAEPRFLGLVMPRRTA